MKIKCFGPVFPASTDAMCLPQLIRLERNLIVAAFRLMKLMPAKYVVEKAWREGRLDNKHGLVETSSGTYALGLGMICAELGVPFHVVSDPAIDVHLKNRLEELGGTVKIVSKDAEGSNLQVLRLNEVRRQVKSRPNVFWPRQYDNVENRHAYGDFAEQLLRGLDRDFTLVATVGSGGSSCGTIETLRRVDPKVRLVGVDTFGSVLFGQPLGKRRLRGLGNSIYPANLRHERFDEVHWVCAEDAFSNTRTLHAKHGLFMGPTSGAAYQVAKWIARRNPDKPVVFIAADEGHRYQTTVYNDEWIAKMGLRIRAPTEVPAVAPSPREASPPWARIAWRRRTFEEMTGEAFGPAGDE